MRMFISRQLTLMALVCCVGQLTDAQIAPVTSPEIERRIQHVTSGLIGGVVIKGDEHANHTLSDRMKELKVPGVSIAVIHAGKIEWARGFGVRSMGGPPVTADTMFQAASVSKPLTAMAVLRLVQQGKLSLDTDVNTYLTSWKLPSDPVTAGKPITLRELLTHTGGITVHGFPGYATNEPVPNLRQVRSSARH
jgi:CubicO group peptidase (beta-lactamase class C family)